MTDPSKNGGVSRRNFLTSGAAAAAAVPLAGAMLADGAAAAPASVAPDPLALQEISLMVNGRKQTFAVDSRMTLLDALREKIGLTGSKKGCDQGQCGACTVHVGGQRVLSCLTLAIAVGDAPVLTIEGLIKADGTLHPMQQAFIDHDAFQCGYCTPGQIMSAVACVNEGHNGSAEEIREYMSGNLCRCAAYPNIVAAIEQAQTKMGA